MDNKPREFHIWNNWFGEDADFSCMYVFGTTIDQMQNIDEDEKIHVIEKSAYDAVAEENERLRDALEVIKGGVWHTKEGLLEIRSWEMQDIADQALKDNKAMGSKKDDSK